MPKDRIRAQVAQVLNAHELVLNRGSTHGVEIGMRFAILNRRGASITDPETGEEIGPVEIAKTLVKVVRLQDRLSVTRTFRTFRVGGGALYGISGLMTPPRTVRESLRTDERPLEAELSEEESLVKIGDPAVQVVGDEFDDQPTQSETTDLD